MCRFVLYLGDEIGVDALVTEPANSIIHQSFHSHERDEPLNGDGFGIGWYVPETTDRPAIFKDVTPAWNNMNLRNLAAVTRSRCVLAHVRAATLGLAVTYPNTHPFAWGPFAFMHNGSINGFPRMRRTLMAKLSEEAFALVQGTTDSELMFALFIDRYRALADVPTPSGASGGAGAFGDSGEAGAEPEDRTSAMTAALLGAVEDVESVREELEIPGVSLLNLAVADGRSAVATRYITRDLERANSLYVHRGGRYVCENGVCRMERSTDGRDAAVLVASEPLSGDPGWEPVPPNHFVSVDPELRTRVAEIARGAGTRHA